MNLQGGSLSKIVLAVSLVCGYTIQAECTTDCSETISMVSTAKSFARKVYKPTKLALSIAGCFWYYTTFRPYILKQFNTPANQAAEKLVDAAGLLFVVEPLKEFSKAIQSSLDSAVLCILEDEPASAA